MPEVTGLSIKDAKNALKELGLDVEVNGETEENKVDDSVIVTDQLPKKGIQVNSGTKVVIYAQ